MKIFQNCLRSNCDQIKYKYESQSYLFQKVYQKYQECIDTKFHEIGMYATEQNNNKMDDNNIIGGELIIQNKIQVQNTQFSLSNNYKKIVKIYQECQNSSSQGLKEFDNLKDCQINCLGQTIESGQSSSSIFNINFILILVFSLIGFTIILFVLYKFIMTRKQREYNYQQDIEEQYQQNQDVENCNHVNEKDQQIFLNSNIIKPSKIIYGPRIKGGLTRLNINKMIEIVNHLKKDNPELNVEGQEIDSNKTQEINQQEQYKKYEDCTDDGISQNSSHMIDSNQFSKMNSHRKAESNIPLIQQNKLIQKANQIVASQHQIKTDLSQYNVLQSEQYTTQLQMLSPYTSKVSSIETSEIVDEKQNNPMKMEFKLEKNLNKSNSEQMNQQTNKDSNSQFNQLNSCDQQQQNIPLKNSNSLNLNEKLIKNSSQLVNEKLQSSPSNTLNDDKQKTNKENQLCKQQSGEFNLKAERSNHNSSQETMSHDNLESPGQSPEYLNRNNSSLMNHISLIKSQMDKKSEDPNKTLQQAQ